MGHGGSWWLVVILTTDFLMFASPGSHGGNVFTVVLRTVGPCVEDAVSSLEELQRGAAPGNRRSRAEVDGFLGFRTGGFTGKAWDFRCLNMWLTVVLGVASEL